MVPHKYLKILFIVIQCSFLGFYIYLLKNPTAWAMSGLVHTIAYIKLQSELAYGTCDISSSSSHVLGQCSTDNFKPIGIGTLIDLLSYMLNLCSSVSIYFIWFKQIIMFAQYLIISIPRMKFTALRYFISNLEDNWDFTSFITYFFVSNQQHVINI